MIDEAPVNSPSDADFEWFVKFLADRYDEERISEETDEGILSISELQGYFSAIASGPSFVEPSQWLADMWGDFQPQWNDEQEFNRAFNIMQSLLNITTDVLSQNPQQFEPLFIEVEIDGEQELIVDDWCHGYLRGILLRFDDWNLESDEMMDLLEPIMTFGSAMMEEYRESLAEQQLLEMQQLIAASAVDIHAYWQADKSSNQLAQVPPHEAGPKTLPAYQQDYLQSLSNQELIELMIKDEDRVPRNLIDECASRGDEIVPTLLEQVYREDITDDPPDLWWMRLHTIMALSLIRGEAAANALLELIDQPQLASDDDLQDWFAGHWPTLTRNKPQSFFDNLRRKCEDSQMDWYLRINLTEALIAHAWTTGGETFEQELDWLVSMVENEEEDWEYRLNGRNVLLDFPRDRFRPLLEDLAARQKGFGVSFSAGNVRDVYAQNQDRPSWKGESELLQFYDRQAIESRQKRWAEERVTEQQGSLFQNDWDEPFAPAIQEPIKRETPKVGRNDPCPCGSGKKYKKCCLH